jgi:hypothetical protein
MYAFGRKRRYVAKKCEFGGTIFDSRLERDRWIYLLESEKNGLISDLELKPRLELVPPFTFLGKKIQGMYFEPDFKFKAKGTTYYNDTKGIVQREYLLKKKMLQWLLTKQGVCDTVIYETKKDKVLSPDWLFDGIKKKKVRNKT